MNFVRIIRQTVLQVSQRKLNRRHLLARILITILLLGEKMIEGNLV